MSLEEKIKSIRKKIDKLDKEILHLLNQRAGLSMEIGRLKKEGDIETYDPLREYEILDFLSSINQGPISNESVRNVFNEIISACRSLVKKHVVTYLGPTGSYTHLACIKNFGSSVDAIPKENIDDVFEAVENGESEYGVVPVENSIEGVVNQTLDMFIEHEVKISGEISIKVSHCLLSINENPKDIKVIYSHPQAFAQCSKWIKRNYPKVKLLETSSTAKAAELASREINSAAIASDFAARVYGLKIIYSHIEDCSNNYTRFFILSKQISKRTGKDKTSVLLSIPHVPGSLFRTLKIFSERGINLTKIESRPIKGRPWEYLFFIDFEGHVEDPDINQALKEMEEKVIFLKLLGSYYRRSR